jgi:ubiquinone/menaquinone biosynthesis C-methylase UbiE
MTAAHDADDRRLLSRYARYAPEYDTRWSAYTQGTLARAVEAVPEDANGTLLDVACGTGTLIAMLRERCPRLSFIGIDLSPEMLSMARQRFSALGAPSVPGQSGNPAAISRLNLQPDAGPELEALPREGHPGAGVELHVGRAEKLPVPAGSVDYLTCTNSFHLVRDQPAALREFHRVLRPAPGSGTRCEETSDAGKTASATGRGTPGSGAWPSGAGTGSEGGTLIMIDWCRDDLAMRLLALWLGLTERQPRRVLTLNQLSTLVRDAGFEIIAADRFHPRKARSRSLSAWGLMRIVALRL